MAHDVFISYSHKDKAIADAICSNLETAGVRCWIAPRDIAPGLDWPAAISNAIAASRMMVLVFSTSSNSSNDVSRELILAANNNLIIIPFKIDNIAPEPGKQYYLARTHWLDAMNPPTQAQIDKLVGYVKSFMSENGIIGTVQHAQVTKRFSEEPVPPVSTAKLPAKKNRPGLWIAGALALIILCSAIGALLWNQRANLPFLSNLFTIPTPTATSTSSPTFTPMSSSTFTPIPPTPTLTATVTPDLRISNPDNQHLYLFVETPETWHEARDVCVTWGGHLVTIQDYNENLLVFRLTSGVPFHSTWLGATDEIQEGKWVWVSGEPWIWVVWDKNQPDNYSNKQHFLSYSDNENLTWDDLVDGKLTFTCEWETTSP
jgi:hypothetical protein